MKKYAFANVKIPLDTIFKLLHATSKEINYRCQNQMEIHRETRGKPE